MAYLFTPPQRRQTVLVHGRSLRVSYPVSQTVWKDQAGVWHAQETPSGDDLLQAQFVTHGSPQVVTTAIGLELITAGIGTCTQIEGTA